MTPQQIIQLLAHISDLVGENAALRQEVIRLGTALKELETSQVPDAQSN